MPNARLDEAQAGIKVARRNINDLRYAGGTTLRTESKEELRSLFMQVKEKSEKAALKLNIQKLRLWHPVTSWQIDVETITDFLFLDSKEIQPVHFEGDLPWDFFGRNDAKTEAPVL